MKNLKKIREAKGLNRKELAKLSGLSYQTITRIELNLSTTTETMITLAKTLGCTLDQLCGIELTPISGVNAKTQDKLSKVIATLIEIEDEWYEGN